VAVKAEDENPPVVADVNVPLYPDVSMPPESPRSITMVVFVVTPTS
jgi:hypothetical protein